jgi:hypothetical protein
VRAKNENGQRSKVKGGYSMTIDDADVELRRHRDAALTRHANHLLAGGADVDGEEFRTKMIFYARDLEKWRRDAMDRLRRLIKAQGETSLRTLN